MQTQWLAHALGQWLRIFAGLGRRPLFGSRRQLSTRALHSLSRHLQRDIGVGALP